MVSALNRNVDVTVVRRFIQTDAAINHGNSGGPLFTCGRGGGGRLGADRVGKGAGSVGLGLAIPSNKVGFVIDQMGRYGQLRAGCLGVRLQPVTPDLVAALRLPGTDGGLVASVWPDGPAARAGLREGDLVLQVGDRKTTDVRALLRAVASNLPGSTVPLELWRDGVRQTLQIELAAWPQAAEMNDPAGAPVVPRSRPAHDLARSGAAAGGAHRGVARGDKIAPACWACWCSASPPTAWPPISVWRPAMWWCACSRTGWARPRRCCSAWTPCARPGARRRCCC